MDDFNMNNKTPLNSSDQNNEQPAAETRNTAPQNEQPAQAPQSEQPMQQPQAEKPAIGILSCAAWKTEENTRKNIIVENVGCST